MSLRRLLTIVVLTWLIAWTAGAIAIYIAGPDVTLWHVLDREGDR